MIFSFSINNVSAAEWNVTPGGSIQNAINGASANDIINVLDNGGAPYTYHENLTLNKTLKIKAKGNVKVQTLNNTKNVFTIYSDGSGSTITGFTITGSSAANAIYLNGANNCNITGNIITNNSYGIKLDNTSINSIISGNRIINNGYGILFYNSSRNTINSNIITNNSVGIDLVSTSNNNIISGNNLNNIVDGIKLDNSSGNNINHNNQISGNENGVFIENSAENNIISGNNITDNIYYGDGGWDGDGIYLYNSLNTTISGNNIINNAYGIYVQVSSGNVHFNRIINNTQYDLFVDASSVNATDNWWGTNNNPLTNGNLHAILCTITYNPWLILTTSINKTKIPDKTGKSIITASLNQDSNHKTAGITVPSGTPIKFSLNPISMGTLTFTSQITNSNGKASTIFKAGSKSGRIIINITVDGVTVQKNIALVNYPPILNFIGNKTINENQMLDFKVKGTDQNGNKLSYSVSVLPIGSSFNRSTNVFKWTPNYNQSGIYYLTFKVTDGKLINKEAVKITVKNVDTFENNIKISNKGTGEIFYDYKLNIIEPNGRLFEKFISGYLNTNTSRNISCGKYKAKTKIGIVEYIYNKAKVNKNIDVINQIIVANKVVFQQRVQKKSVKPSPDNILYPVKF